MTDLDKEYVKEERRVTLQECTRLTEEDWVPIRLEDDLCQLAIEKGTLQEEQSKRWKLNDRQHLKDPVVSLKSTIWSKRAEYAVHQWAGRKARVTEPGEFHNMPDVGQVNVRFAKSTTIGLVIQERDQGDLPMVYCTTKDYDFNDKVVWLVGWGMTGILRNLYFVANETNYYQELPFKWHFHPIQKHEQFAYPPHLLNPMKTLSKDFINLPYVERKK